MNTATFSFEHRDVDLLISALWTRIVYLDTQWRIVLADGKTEAAAVLHAQLMECESMIRVLKAGKDTIGTV